MLSYSPFWHLNYGVCPPLPIVPSFVMQKCMIFSLECELSECMDGLAHMHIVVHVKLYDYCCSPRNSMPVRVQLCACVPYVYADWRGEKKNADDWHTMNAARGYATSLYYNSNWAVFSWLHSNSESFADAHTMYMYVRKEWECIWILKAKIGREVLIDSWTEICNFMAAAARFSSLYVLVNTLQMQL